MSSFILSPKIWFTCYDFNKFENMLSEYDMLHEKFNLYIKTLMDLKYFTCDVSEISKFYPFKAANMF